jgi:hypothetical protein
MGLPRCSTVVLHRQNPAVREAPDFEGLFRCPKSVAEREGLSPPSAFNLAYFDLGSSARSVVEMIARNTFSIGLITRSVVHRSPPDKFYGTPVF